MAPDVQFDHQKPVCFQRRGAHWGQKQLGRQGHQWQCLASLSGNATTQQPILHHHPLQ